MLCVTALCHAPRERVSWNIGFVQAFLNLRSSRSTWACELKWQNVNRKRNWKSHAPRERVSWNRQQFQIHNFFRSHAPRERVSWNTEVVTSPHMERGHAPRERVSWNKNPPLLRTQFAPVTLHVSVWVEMLWAELLNEWATVTLHVSVWVEILWATKNKISWFSHAPRERVSWNSMTIPLLVGGLKSRSTWACELKWKQGKQHQDGKRHAPRERVSWNALH